MNQSPFKSGYVSILGRPNVGKSTLLNSLLGQKIAIVSPKPQTTRNRILGIKSLSNAQMIFIDTPGIHDVKGQLNTLMVREAMKTYRDVDLILLMIEADGSGRKDNLFIMGSISGLDKPVILLINKIDRVKKGSLLRLIDEYRGKREFKEIIPISALHGDGLDELEKQLLGYLPEGPKYFPEDMITDQPERFIASEIIREKAFHLLGEELPYSVAVTIDEFKEREQKGIIYIRANIHVERDSQKGILIGKRGAMLKKIGQYAREDLEYLFGIKIFLDLWVKVQKNWTRDERALKEFGYR